MDINNGPVLKKVIYGSSQSEILKKYYISLSKPDQISLYFVKILSLRYQEKINQADDYMVKAVHSFEADAMQYGLTLDINNGPVLKAH